MKKIAIPIIFFNPPKNPIKIGNVKIISAKFEDISKEYIEAPIKCGPGGDMVELQKRRFGKDPLVKESVWANIIIDRTDIHFTCYQSLFDLVTNHWNYEINRNDKLRKPRLDYNYTWDPPSYNFNKIILKKIKNGLDLIEAKTNNGKKFQIALQRWYSSYNREDYLDTVIDCCSSLESLFSIENELRLRTSLLVYSILKENKKVSAQKIYTMYEIRNKFVHGSKIPLVNKQEALDLIKIVANVLLEIIITKKIPDQNFDLIDSVLK